MVAIHNPDKDSESKPELSVFLIINKQDTFDFYEQDKEYYVDFIPVKEEK